MKRLLVLFLVLPACLVATPPEKPGPVLEAGEGGAAWTSLFKTLSAPKTIFSEFREERWFGFRKTPVVLDGEMRLAPGHGLSLHYVKPKERTMVIDSKGALLRDARGRERQMPSDPRAVSIEQALLPALRFDLPAIRTYFVIHAARDGDDWRLDLEPKDSKLHRTMGNLMIEGHGATVKQLEFRRSAKQRVVIEILSTREGEPFSADELKRYFR